MTTTTTTTEKTVIVTVRHPDRSNEHHSFGPAVKTVDIDLGSSFDVTQIGEEDWSEVLEWACGLYADADCVEGASPDAASFIRGVAEETLATCLPFGSDSCDVAHHIIKAREEES